MTFYGYMMKFINDESPLGDLAYARVEKYL